MTQFNSLENQVTEGVVQFIPKISTDLNKIEFFFSNNPETEVINKKLVFKNFDNLSIKYDYEEDFFDEDQILESLIGITELKTKSIWEIVIKSDLREIILKTTQLPTIESIT